MNTRSTVIVGQPTIAIDQLLGFLTEMLAAQKALLARTTATEAVLRVAIAVTAGSDPVLFRRIAAHLEADLAERHAAAASPLDRAQAEATDRFARALIGRAPDV